MMLHDLDFVLSCSRHIIVSFVHILIHINLYHVVYRTLYVVNQPFNVNIATVCCLFTPNRQSVHVLRDHCDFTFSTT